MTDDGLQIKVCMDYLVAEFFDNWVTIYLWGEEQKKKKIYVTYIFVNERCYRFFYSKTIHIIKNNSRVTDEHIYL